VRYVSLQDEADWVISNKTADDLTHEFISALSSERGVQRFMTGNVIYLIAALTDEEATTYGHLVGIPFIPRKKNGKVSRFLSAMSAYNGIIANCSRNVRELQQLL
jgi:hypothetical protein